MISPDLRKKLLLLTAAGGLLGLGLAACVIGGELDCSTCDASLLCHSNPVGNDCVCDNGYQFVTSNDPKDEFKCEPIPNKPGDCTGPNLQPAGDQCACVSGFVFCNDNPNDLSCCPDTSDTDGMGPAGPGDDDDGDTMDTGDESADETGDGGACVTDEPPFIGMDPLDRQCSADSIDTYYCTNTAAQGPAGSILYRCTDGGWVDASSELTDDCVGFQGFEFAHGCTAAPEEPLGYVALCGNGPGTFCDGVGCDTCLDADSLAFCEFDNKLESISCSTLCSEEGIDGVTFDSGFCTDDAEGLTCACCNFDDEENPCPR